MPMFKVLVTETVEHELWVDADDEGDAIDLAEEMVAEDNDTYFAGVSREGEVVGDGRERQI